MYVYIYIYNICRKKRLKRGKEARGERICDRTRLRTNSLEQILHILFYSFDGGEAVFIYLKKALSR